MKNYIEYISQLSKGRIDKDFSNCDEDHALEVLERIFQESTLTIRILAGSLCSTVPNDPRYVAALSDFIEKGGKVEIILNEFDPEKAGNANIIKRLAYYSSLGKQVEVYQTDIRPYLANDPERNPVHFTIGDERAYRVETDIQKRTANCNFNNPGGARGLIAVFNKIKKRATKLNLIGIFPN